jgi:hypothetical protein
MLLTNSHKLFKYTVSSKKNARIIKTYHSKTVTHIEMIQVLKCGKITKVLDTLNKWVGVASERATLRRAAAMRTWRAVSQCQSVSVMMWTIQQKAQFVLWYAELKSVVAVQCKWQTLHPGEKAPGDKALNRWLKQFEETGSVAKQKSSGRPRSLEENVERIRQSCVRSPKKAIAHRSLALGIPKSTIQNVLHKRLCLHAYKIELKHEIRPDDWPKRSEYADFMLNQIDDNETFLRQVCFTDEVTFHVDGCVNQHNCRIWGSEQPNEIHEYISWFCQSECLV